MPLLLHLPIFVAFILALMIVSLPLGHAQTIDDLKAGVVKIKAKTGRVGTGFIVRVEQEKVFIITAAHVIVGDSQPEVEFFLKRNEPLKGAVLPGAEVHDDVQGLALVMVRGQDFLSKGLQSLAFGLSTDLVSGGEEALIIGHPSGGGDWTVVKRDIANRVGRKITLDPGMAARFSGGPLLVENKVMGIVMTDQGGFGAGSTHKSVLNYMEGFGVVPSTVAIVDTDQPASTPTPVNPQRIRPPQIDQRIEGGIPNQGDTSRDLVPEENIATLKKGVVKVTTQFSESQKVGTGFIVAKGKKYLYIVTASHVIEPSSHQMLEIPNSIQVTFFTQQEEAFTAKVVRKEGDDPRGLALLKVGGDLPNNIEVLKWDTSSMVHGGEEIYLIGFPRIGGNPWAVTKAMLSGFDGPVLKFSGSVSEGNSGGPLLFGGKVIGVLMEVTGQFGNATPAHIAKFTVENWPGFPRPRVTKAQPYQMPKNLAKEIAGKDGAPMVLVPAGAFTMGSPDGEGLANEHPPHVVALDAFYIDQYEVTVERYRRFLKKTSRGNPKYWEQVELGRDVEKPVVGVTWDDALAYCEWAGKRLPTEAEWEKAARGRDKRLYPWGPSQPNWTTANFGKADKPQQAYEETLKPVGSYELGKSSYGAYDMAGNVSEWVADWYEEGPSSREWKVVRGGSWKDKPTALRSTYRLRFPTLTRNAFFGVRCAQDAS